MIFKVPFQPKLFCDSVKIFTTDLQSPVVETQDETGHIKPLLHQTLQAKSLTSSSKLDT